MKLYKSKFRLERKKHYFLDRVIDGWNKLPANVVNSTSVNTFKVELDRHWDIVRGGI